MLYAIISTDISKGRLKNWISAIGSNPPSLAGLPIEYDHSVVRFKGTYPVYIIEKDNEFSQVSILGIPGKSDDDGEDCILYTFKEDWHSPKAGKDQMGLLDHVHINYDKHMKLVFPY